MSWESWEHMSMRQRRKIPGRSVGKCRSKVMVAPDRESCSISALGAERTNPNEMQGVEAVTAPVTKRCPVSPPCHAPSAPTLNTPKSPNTDRQDTFCLVQCQANFMPTTQKSRGRHWISPETGSAAFGTSIWGHRGNPVSVQKLDDGTCQ